MTDIRILFSTNIVQALKGAHSPSAINPFATLTDISGGAFIPLGGTNVGSPLTGTVDFEPLAASKTAFVSTTQDYFIGAGDNIDLGNSATKYASIYFAPGTSPTVAVEATDGATYDCGFTAFSGGIQIIGGTPLLSTIHIITTGGAHNIRSNFSNFIGTSYELTTAGYVLTNQTSLSILHRSANDARYFKLSDILSPLNGGTGINNGTNTITVANNFSVPSNAAGVLTNNGSGVLSWIVPSSGTVTTFSFANGNGFTGSVTNSTTTPALSLVLQNASTSQNGQLTSTDWNTFNNKQSALTNPITGTGVVGQVAFFIGTTSQSSNSNYFWDNTNSRLGLLTNSPTTTLQIGSGTTPNFPKDLYIRRDGSGLAPGINITNANSAGITSIALEENGTNFAGVARYNSAYGASAFGSTNIAQQASMSFQSGNLYQMPMVFGGMPIFLFTGNSASNAAVKLDATGVRIDACNAVGITNNTNLFTVNGKSCLGTNSTATYQLDVMGGDLGIGTANKTLRLPATRLGTATLVSGTKAISLTGLTTSSYAFVQQLTPGGTQGTQYKAVCTSGTLTITAISTIGATVTTDTSTLNYIIFENY